MTNISTVLFDLDGTLIDSSKDLIAAYCELLKEHGLIPPCLQQLKQDVAHGINHLFERDFSAQPGTKKNKELRQAFTQIYENQLTQHTVLFTGIDAILQFLSDHQIPWGIVTNKIERFTHPIVDHFEPLRAAQIVVCGDTLPERKPDPHPITYACQKLQATPNKTAFVGDTQIDILAAKRAGAKGIAVGYNIPISAVEAEEWGANVLLDQPGDLLVWLKDNCHSSSF